MMRFAVSGMYISPKNIKLKTIFAQAGRLIAPRPGVGRKVRTPQGSIAGNARHFRPGEGRTSAAESMYR